MPVRQQQLQNNILKNNTKEDNPYSINLLIRTPIFESQVCGLVWIQEWIPKDTCL